MLAWLGAGSAGQSPASAAPAPGGWTVVAQADTSFDPDSTQGEEGADEDNGVKIPPNLLVPGPDTPPPDSTGAAAPTDSSGILLPAAPAPPDSGRAVMPPQPAEPETIRYVQPNDPAVTGKAPAPNLVPVAPKKKGGVFGMTPAIVILSLAVVHFFVVKSVK